MVRGGGSVTKKVHIGRGNVACYGRKEWEGGGGEGGVGWMGGRIDIGGGGGGGVGEGSDPN